MTINIWLATWNCENQAPDANMLNDFLVNDINGLPAAQKPDIIVVGLQEADINSSFQRQFVSERLAKPNRLGNDYDHIASSYAIGVTKGKKNYLQLGVLVKRNVGNVAILAQETGSYRDGAEGKGGVFVKFNYILRNPNNNQLIADFNLGFINAHLNSRNVNTRETEITEILRTITNSNRNATSANIRTALQNNFDAVFFMGDLNYRLREDPANGFNHQNITVGTLLNFINNQQGRTALWTLDTLQNSSLVDSNPVQANEYGFTFPRADHLLPTYKRYYQDRTVNNPCRLLANQFIAGNPLNPGHIQSCYFQGLQDQDPAPYNANRQAFELGWLDRIGYKIGLDPQNNPSVNVQAQPLESKDEIVLSDHTPVIMKVQVN